MFINNGSVIQRFCKTRLFWPFIYIALLSLAAVSLFTAYKMNVPPFKTYSFVVAGAAVSRLIEEVPW